MDGDDRQAAMLVAQVGGMPNELQIILETAQYDDEREGLRPLHNYIIRVLGVTEHRILNLGTTRRNDPTGRRSPAFVPV